MYIIPYEHIPWHLRLTNRHLMSPYGGMASAPPGPSQDGDFVEVEDEDEDNNDNDHVGSFIPETPEEKALIHHLEELVRDAE